MQQIYSLIKKLPSPRGLSQFTLSNIGLLYKSSFVLLMSHFDFLFSDLIRYFHRKYPENLSEKEFSFTFNELKQFDSVSDVLDFAINKEVEKILYANLAEQKKYFKSHMKVDLKEKIIDWGRITEAVERRNIIVHNNGMVNKRYLKNADLSAIPSEAKQQLKEGAKITVDKDYLDSVFNEIFSAGVILIQSCWRKWDGDSVNGADLALIAIVYEALSKEKWQVAERLGCFGKECEAHNERNHLYLAVNYCQSLKWQGKNDELSKELEQFDPTSLRPIYLLAYYTLKSDIDNFFKYVKDAINVDNMGINSFFEWPLFREFRQNPNFMKTIKKSFRAAKRKGKSVAEIPKTGESPTAPV